MHHVPACVQETIPAVSGWWGGIPVRVTNLGAERPAGDLIEDECNERQQAQLGARVQLPRSRPHLQIPIYLCPGVENAVWNRAHIHRSRMFTLRAFFPGQC